MKVDYTHDKTRTKDMHCNTPQYKSQGSKKQAGSGEP